MAPSRGTQPIPRDLHVTLNSHKGPVNVARYAKGSAKYILTGGQDRTVRLWNANLGTEIKTFSGHGYEVLSLTVYVKAALDDLAWTYLGVLVLTIMPNLHHRGETGLSSYGMSPLAKPSDGSPVTWAKSTQSNSMRTPALSQAVR